MKLGSPEAMRQEPPLELRETEWEKEIRRRNIAELNRQLERAEGELRTLEHLSQYDSHTHRHGIKHYKDLIQKLENDIDRLSSV